jgi:hypothetical protein
MKRLSIAALLLGAMSAPASAANPGTDPAQAASAQAPSASGDPNQVICEKVDKIGTRLGSSRVCMTRAEWTEQRRLNRDTVDHAQQTRCQSLDPPDNSC